MNEYQHGAPYFLEHGEVYDFYVMVLTLKADLLGYEPGQAARNEHSFGVIPRLEREYIPFFQLVRRQCAATLTVDLDGRGVFQIIVRHRVKRGLMEIIWRMFTNDASIQEKWEELKFSDLPYVIERCRRVKIPYHLAYGDRASLVFGCLTAYGVWILFHLGESPDVIVAVALVWLLLSTLVYVFTPRVFWYAHASV